MQKSSQQFTTRHAAWFCCGMAIVTIGLSTTTMQHTHRPLLWIGMALMMLGVAVASVPVLHPAKNPEEN